MTNRRGGFTLVEVLVALGIGVLLALTVQRAFSLALASVQALADRRERTAARPIAERWLRAAIESIDTGAPGAAVFNGEPQHVRASAFVLSDEGWLERRSLDVGVSDGVLVLREGGRRIVLADGVESLEIDYLLEPGASTKWVQRWESPTSVPLAIRLRVQSRVAGGPVVVDTCLYLIGERG